MLLNRAHFQNTSCFCFVRLCHQNKYTSNVEAINISQITLKGITVKCFWTVHGWASQAGWVTNPLLPLENFLPHVLGGIWHIFQLWFSNHETVDKKEEKYWMLFSHKINKHINNKKGEICMVNLRSHCEVTINTPVLKYAESLCLLEFKGNWILLLRYIFFKWVQFRHEPIGPGRGNLDVTALFQGCLTEWKWLDCTNVLDLFPCT